MLHREMTRLFLLCRRFSGLRRGALPRATCGADIEAMVHTKPRKGRRRENTWATEHRAGQSCASSQRQRRKASCWYHVPCHQRTACGY